MTKICLSVCLSACLPACLPICKTYTFKQQGFFNFFLNMIEFHLILLILALHFLFECCNLFPNSNVVIWITTTDLLLP